MKRRIEYVGGPWDGRAEVVKDFPAREIKVPRPRRQSVVSGEPGDDPAAYSPRHLTGTYRIGRMRIGGVRTVLVYHWRGERWE